MLIFSVLKQARLFSYRRNQGDQKTWRKSGQFWAKKVAKTVVDPKKAKMSTSKLDFQGQNFYIKSP